MAAPIVRWLVALGFERYADAFVAADIDLDVLAELSDGDLAALGVTLGDRKRILRAIAAPAPAIAPPRSPVGERRQLTILFCDLVGSTALAAELDPEDLRDVVKAYHERCSEIVTAYEGEVAQFLGDGVMVQFGYPRARENDVERAVFCGLAMVGAVGELVVRSGVKLSSRVGIATGTEVVGDLAGAARDRASVVGTTPSLASRLQGLAEPGTVVVGPTTRRLLGDQFALVPLGEFLVRGVDGPVPVWRVDGEAHAASRFVAHHAALMTTFVGREHEMRLLADRFEIASAGRGQGVLLVADAGVGKSRVVEEFLSRGFDCDAIRVRLQCSPHHTASALYPAVEALSQAIGLDPGDAAPLRRSKLTEFCARSSSGDAALGDTLASLVFPPGADDARAIASLTADQRRALLFRTLVNECIVLAKRRPLVLFVEDLHWIDPTTLALLTRLVDAIEDVPIFVIATARPEFVSPWSHSGLVTTLSLNRLAGPAVATMIRNLCGERTLPADVLAQIVERTDGVALFVEELTKSVLESSGGESSAVPVTLRDALTARLDALAPIRDIAQAGAVIGRECPEELLARVVGREESMVGDALGQLVASGLGLRYDGTAGATFRFKHALVRDVAYDGLLRPRRRDLHLRTARTLVEHFVSTVELEPETVAHHFEEGGAAREAIEFRVRAAVRATDRSAYREAISHLRRALALVPLTAPDGGVLELDLRNRIGIVTCTLEGGRSDTVREMYERGWVLAQDLPESRATFTALWGLCFCDYMSGRVVVARERSVRMLAMAERLGDEDLILEALHAGWGAGASIGDFILTLEATERGVAIYDPQQHHRHVTSLGIGHDSGICGHGHRSSALAFSGRIAEARRSIEATEALIRRLDHPFSQCIGLNHIGLSLDLLGDYDAVASVANESLELAKRHAFSMPLAISSLLIGAAHIGRGERDAGLALLRSVLDEPTNGAPMMYRHYFASHLALAELASGDALGAAVRLDAVERSMLEVGGDVTGYDLHRVRAWIADAFAHHEDASAYIDRAIDDARARGARLLELRYAVDRVEFALRGSRGDAARIARAELEMRAVLQTFDDRDDALDLRRARALAARANVV